MSRNTLNTLKEFKITDSKKGKFYSLPALEKKLGINISRLPISIRIVLESVLRNCDGKKVTEESVSRLANWQPNAPRTDEIPFVVSRVVLQDFTGVPLLVDLAAMRGAAERVGGDPKRIEPMVPVDLVVDHSVQVDHFREKKALDLNMKIEFQRNNERYQFMKWGMQAFETFRVVPPGFGIVHQVNLEYLARGVHKKATDKGTVYYPDTLVGTDSHTTMINGIGVVGWGVGGIEAEAAMLGQPVYMLTPDVVGVNLTGQLREGVTATDLVLTITEVLRKEKVVGKFVEFFGEGTSSLSVTDRATLGNMAPEYGATMGFFPVDEATIDYFRGTGRTKAEIDAFEAYFRAQKIFGVPKSGEIDYTTVVALDLGSVSPSLAGPRRPQDRIDIGNVKTNFAELFVKPIAEGGFNKKEQDLHAEYVNSDGVKIKNGDVLIAAITSCTNTSNPSVMLAAGLLAKKAVEAGLKIPRHVKTSLAPGSRVVTEYLKAAGLFDYLEKVGFGLAAYGCTTCIGNSGDLTPAMNEALVKDDIIAAAVLSGNRNFEARIHPNLRSNFLMSPPLVVAYAIAGNMMIDLMTEPLGRVKGRDIYLGDIWPTSQEIGKLMRFALNGKTFRENYASIKTAPGKLWEQISGVAEGEVYDWPASSYIAEPPFFDGFALQPPAAATSIIGARALGVFGDSITTDHISPAGAIKESGPAGKWLKERGVTKADFNSFGSRRGHHEVMMRGTFANVRIKNLMIPPTPDGSRVEGGFTLHQPSGEQMSIYDAAMRYVNAGVPTVIITGEEYGTGSSRDWAAKGTQLLGVKAVVARSYERIHRSNLVGMGVLPLQFIGTDSAETLGIRGDETFDVTGLEGEIKPLQEVTLVINRANGQSQNAKVLLRIDTPIEVDYYNHGGILPFVLRQLLAA
jgi:aconitate hydratase